MSDDLSGDMLAPSWPNLVISKSIADSQFFLKYLIHVLLEELSHGEVSDP